jgi:hypothetical protein
MGVPKAGHTPDASWPELNVVLELDSWELMIHLPDRTGAKLRKTVALSTERQRRAA